MTVYKTDSTMTHLQNYLDKHTTSYQKTMEQLSSGNKYTSINDNPVNVSNSIKLGIQIDGNLRASSNIALGQDMLSMAEEEQENVLSNINRIKDLSMQAANGTFTAADKDDILEEIRARLNYIDSAAESTNFNGIQLLDGTTGNVQLQIGSGSDNTMDISDAFTNVKTTALGIDLDPSINGSNWTNSQINTYMASLDDAASSIITTCTQIGSYLNSLDAASEALSSTNLNLTAKKSAITDTDVAEASADLVKYQIAQQASASVFAQTNKISALALELLK